jgi:segregation and condensation protein A
MEAPILGDPKVNYHIKTQQFEGPLDLLLMLIEKRKLFVNDIALANVADDYIAHIRQFEQFPIADVANFLLVASTLVLIKSKSILPALNLTKEEEGDIDDLKRRLALYELFRDLSVDIKGRYGKEIIYERSGRPEAITVYAFDPRLSIDLLAQAADSVLKALPKKEALPKVTVKKVISLEEMINRLTKRVQHSLKTSFGQFSRYKKGEGILKEHRIEIIVSFLAMLELVKQGMIHVAQHEQHGDIDIETHAFETPHYGDTHA